MNKDELEFKCFYLKRLITPYIGGGERKIFFDQFINGSGNELDNKFWSPRSSSRLCFDLYSCFVHNPKVRDIEFEYKLPPIYSAGKKASPPNMDVYIETDDYIVFIESKFTEIAKNADYKKNLSKAYWVKGDKSDPSDGNLVIESIEKRFTFKDPEPNKEQEDLLDKMREEFPKFCKGSKGIFKLIADLSKDGKLLKDDWFDAKQETCHIFGILLYAIKYQPKKKIHFYNIVFDKRTSSALAKEFVKRANNLFRNVLGGGKVTYNIDLKIKDVLDIFGNEKGFAATDRYSKDLIHNDLKNLYVAYKEEKLSDSNLRKRIKDGQYYDFPDDDAILVKNLSVKALMDKT